MYSFKGSLMGITLIPFLFIFFVLGSFYFSGQYCDEHRDIDCPSYIFGVSAVLSIIGGVSLFLIQRTDRYRNFQEKGGINLITGILEIIIAPFVGFLVWFLWTLAEWSPQYTHTPYEKYFFGSIVAIFIIGDGIRRIIKSRKNKNPREQVSRIQ